MKKIIAYILPLIDYLYIFQLLEYDSRAFLQWFSKYPLERNLQRKHSIVWSKKLLLLAVLTVFLMFIPVFLLCYALYKSTLLGVLLFVLFQYIAPFFIIAAKFLLYPVEMYTKKKILSAARTKRQRLKNLTVIAIVGSFAKTSTKDMLYTLLWKDFRVVKTPKSFNTPLSVARTLLSDVKENTEVFIVEMDAYKPGEIDELCRLVNPKIGIITAIAPQHLERFGSMETLAQTQFEIAQHIQSNGVLILNSSSEWIMKLTRDYPSVKKHFYGLRENDDVRVTDVRQLAEGLALILHTSRDSVDLSIPLYGEHHALNFAGAASAALMVGLPVSAIQRRASLLLPTPHRLEVKKLGAVTLIDNSYNSNPAAFDASLQVLQVVPGSQKIIITPGFIEVGKDQSAENKKLAQKAAKIANEFIIVGENAKADLLQGLESTQFPKKNVYTVKSTQEALQLLREIAPPQSVVLIENDLPDQYF